MEGIFFKFIVVLFFIEVDIDYDTCKDPVRTPAAKKKN